MHSGEKPFNSKQCEFSGTQAGNLKRHMLVHIGETPLKCKQCDNLCAESSHIKNHTLVHSGEKTVAVKVSFLSDTF